MVKVAKEDVVERVNERVNRLLTVIELCVPQEKYPVFRKFVLDEFGRSGLGRDLDALWQKGRDGQDG